MPVACPFSRRQHARRRGLTPSCLVVTLALSTGCRERTPQPVQEARTSAESEASRTDHDVAAQPKSEATDASETESDAQPACPDEPRPFETSDLPILLIRTEQRNRFTSHHRGLATLSVFDNATGRSDPSQQPSLSTKIELKLHGNSSKRYDKKSYGFELQRDVDGKHVDHDAALLSMPAEEDWVLHGPYADRSLMRNAVAYTLSASTSLDYTPRHRFVELFLGRRGPPLAHFNYRGVYLLVEKIKRDPERVAVSDKGFLLEQTTKSKIKGHEKGFDLRSSGMISVKYPRPEDITPRQFARIKAYVTKADRLLHSDGFDHPRRGWETVLDRGSFIDAIIVYEFLKNRDAFHASTFYTLEPSERLKAGPVWDFNISSGHDDNPLNAPTVGWQYRTREGWNRRLFRSPRFRTAVAKRWKELRVEAFSDERLLEIVSGFRVQLDEAQVRNFCRWNKVLGAYVWPSPGPYEKSFHEAVQRLADWLVKRAHWLDENFPTMK